MENLYKITVDISLTSQSAEKILSTPLYGRYFYLLFLWATAYGSDFTADEIWLYLRYEVNANSALIEDKIDHKIQQTRLFLDTLKAKASKDRHAIESVNSKLHEYQQQHIFLRVIKKFMYHPANSQFVKFITSINNEVFNILWDKTKVACQIPSTVYALARLYNIACKIKKINLPLAFSFKKIMQQNYFTFDDIKKLIYSLQIENLAAFHTNNSQSEQQLNENLSLLKQLFNLSQQESDIVLKEWVYELASNKKQAYQLLTEPSQPTSYGDPKAFSPQFIGFLNNAEDVFMVLSLLKRNHLSPQQIFTLNNFFILNRVIESSSLILIQHVFKLAIQSGILLKTAITNFNFNLLRRAISNKNPASIKFMMERVAEYHLEEELINFKQFSNLCCQSLQNGKIIVESLMSHLPIQFHALIHAEFKKLFLEIDFEKNHDQKKFPFLHWWWHEKMTESERLELQNQFEDRHRLKLQRHIVNADFSTSASTTINEEKDVSHLKSTNNELVAPSFYHYRRLSMMMHTLWKQPNTAPTSDTTSLPNSSINNYMNI